MNYITVIVTHLKHTHMHTHIHSNNTNDNNTNTLWYSLWLLFLLSLIFTPAALCWWVLKNNTNDNSIRSDLKRLWYAVWDEITSSMTHSESWCLFYYATENSPLIFASSGKSMIEQVAELVFNTLKFWRPIFSHHPLSSFYPYIRAPCSFPRLFPRGEVAARPSRKAVRELWNFVRKSRGAGALL